MTKYLVQVDQHGSCKTLVNINDTSLITAESGESNEIDESNGIDEIDLKHRFHGDIINTSGELISTEIDKKQIPGILMLNSKYKYGYNKKKMARYMFKPLSSHYPYFLVASSRVPQFTNIYVTIEFMQWVDGGDFPMGQLVDIIGDCDDINNTYNAIIRKYNLSTISIKYCGRAPPSNFDPQQYFSAEQLINHKVCNNYIFSVDPAGCTDIDDALSISLMSNNHYRVGVHIADVGFYVEHFGLIVQPHRYSTIYAPHKTYNMLPDIFSNNICSLRPDINRLAFTVWIDIARDGTVIDYFFEKTIIKSSKAYSYDELQAIIDRGDSSEPAPEHQLYNLARGIGNPNGFAAEMENMNVIDVHKMVETYMILANSLVGKYLHDHISDKSKIIYRTHSRRIEPCSKLPSSLPSDVYKLLEIMQSRAAIYTVGSTATASHDSLGLEYYTHFTSPIRRYVDVYIHRLLSSLHGYITPLVTTDTADLCTNINAFNTNIRRAERDIARLELARMIADTDIHNLEAFILDIVSNGIITLYLSKYKVIQSYKLVNILRRKIVDAGIVQIVIIPNVEIKIVAADNKVVLHVYDKISVDIVMKLYSDDIQKKSVINIPSIDYFFESKIEKKNKILNL